MSDSRTSTLRPEQKEIVLDYAGGQVGVAAVPGSGKTFTLAHLAARLIAKGALGRDQEVLVVTFTNSAVNCFQARIAGILRDQHKLLPNVGYRVRTLHGLAHDIVRERPALVGLADDFVILDEKLALDIQHDVVFQLWPEWNERLNSYVASDQQVNPKMAHRGFEEVLPGLVTSFIKHAKNARIGPEDILAVLHGVDRKFDLAQFAAHVYANYQRSLAYRGAVDFDDLVRLALSALEMDEHYLARLSDRWPYILEDEAQDSSRLQEYMLRLLSRRQNWVRVGDPNQAINTTFTTAEPRFLLEFLDSDVNPGAVERSLSVSGRSTPLIIALANELVRWAIEEHPVPELRDAFTLRQDKQKSWRGVIRSVPPGDPQPNPSDSQGLVHIEYQPGRKITPDQELDMVVSGEDFAIVHWLQEMAQFPQEEQPTVAMLVPENSRGFKLVERLQKYNVPYEELLRSTTATRQAVTLLQAVLQYLSDSTDLRNLKKLYWDCMSEEQQVAVREDIDLRQAISDLFSRWRNVEDFLWPDGSPDFSEVGEYSWLVGDLEHFRHRVRRWLQAASLPVDQLVLTVGQDLFSDPADVALTYKVAVVLRDTARDHPEWRLPQFVEELKLIGGNQRRFIGFDDAEVGYEPKRGVVTVATMHAAKGMEWDRVYLLAVNNYGFPSAMPYDSYVGERWFARDGLNLEAELLSQLDAVYEGQMGQYVEGQATWQSRLEYSRERLRLLYVGMTRARRELIITWNMGRFWQQGRENQPALPVVMLKQFLDESSPV